MNPTKPTPTKEYEDMLKKIIVVANINGKWCMTWEEDNAIACRPLYWWEKILYWKFDDKSIKGS